MNEVITYQSPEAIRQLHILDEFMASLDADRLLSTNDLYAATDTYLGIDEMPNDSLDAQVDSLEELVKDPTVLSRHGVVADSANIKPLATIFEATMTPTVKRTHETAKRRFKKVGMAAAAVILTVMGTRAIDTAVNNTEDARDAVGQYFDNLLFNNEEIVSAIAPTGVAKAEVPTIETPPVVMPVVLRTAETTTTTVAEVVVEPTPATVAPEVVESTTTVAETLPVELTLSQKILAGETTLSENRGMPLGTLRLDKYCDTVAVSVNNPIDFTIAENLPYLSADAQAKAALLAGPGLSRDERRMLADDIMQSGLPDGSGDPLYAAYPDNTPEDGCVPSAPNPRASRAAYGSTPVVQAGGFADQYQSTAVISEFGAMPGSLAPGSSVAYISGHNTSQSASFNGLRNYTVGDTVTYAVDGQNRAYIMTGKQKINGKQSFNDIMTMLNGTAEGREQLVLQVCIDGNPDDRSLYIFDLA